jgi:hypothetical protein
MGDTSLGIAPRASTRPASSTRVPCSTHDDSASHSPRRFPLQAPATTNCLELRRWHAEQGRDVSGHDVSRAGKTSCSLSNRLSELREGRLRHCRRFGRTERHRRRMIYRELGSKADRRPRTRYVAIRPA